MNDFFSLLGFILAIIFVSILVLGIPVAILCVTGILLQVVLSIFGCYITFIQAVSIVTLIAVLKWIL